MVPILKGVDLCEAFYDSPEVVKWLSRPNLKCDLFLIDVALGECIYGLVYKFKAKHVLFAPVLPEHIWDKFGLVPESASIPDYFFHRKPDNMGFTSRLVGTLTPALYHGFYMYYSYKVEAIFRTMLNDPDIPFLSEIQRNTSLILLNSNFIDDYPRALPPFMVPFSGLWCGKDKRNKRAPLPADLSSFIEKGDVFIYVSFGSAIMISQLPEERLQHLISAFAAFPHIKFLWRWTGKTAPNNLSKNVFLRKWFPQKDLLANPKAKGFITQAGRPSTQEAICYGVPMITFPIFGDQDANANRLEQVGVGINFDIGDFTSESLKAAIKELIYNPSYGSRMKELSRMFQDRPIDPVDNALFWTEYVLRHDDTSLMKPLGMKYSWWQKRLLDVYAVIIFIVMCILTVFFAIIYLTIKFLLRLCLKKVKTE